MTKIFAVLIAIAFIGGCDVEDVNFELETMEATESSKICFEEKNGSIEPCAVEVTVSVEPSQCRIALIDTNAKVEFNRHGRNDSSSGAGRNEGNAQTLSMNVTFNEVQGGTARIPVDIYLHTTGRCPVGPYKRTYVKEIVGTNPDSKQVCDRMNSLPVSATLYYRTGFKMFDSSGEPLHKDGKFGMALIADPNASQIWDWHENVDSLQTQFQTYLEAARNYPAEVRSATGMPYPDFPDGRLIREAIARQEGGQWFEPHPNLPTWQESASVPQAARDIADVVAAVEQGNPPDGWCSQ